MCYSKSWMAEDERKQREAKVKGVEANRSKNHQGYAYRRREAGESVRRFQSAREHPCKVNREDMLGY